MRPDAPLSAELAWVIAFGRSRGGESFVELVCSEHCLQRYEPRAFARGWGMRRVAKGTGDGGFMPDSRSGPYVRQETVQGAWEPQGAGMLR